MYSYQSTTFDLTSQLSTPSAEFDLNQLQRHDSIDYSRRPSYFTGLLGNPQSEASYSDHEQQTPSPFNGYEDYQQQHPLDNTKRRLSTMELSQMYYNMDYNVVSPWLTSSTTHSPMMYAHPSVDLYSSQTYQQSAYHPLCVPAEGIYRERATSSSSSSSDNSSMSVSPPPATTANNRRGTKKSAQLKSTVKSSRGRRVSNSPSIAGQKMFTCNHDDCGKVFKRSEHLKRHIRSIHTLEKRKFTFFIR